MVISMLKIRRPLGHLIFNMGIAIPGKTVFLIETAPWVSRSPQSSVWLTVTEDQSKLVQVMAWCRQATSHCLSQCWPRSLLLYGVTRPQWVNMISYISFGAFFDLRLNKRLNKQSWGWWFETLSHPLWHHSNEQPSLSSGAIELVISG